MVRSAFDERKNKMHKLEKSGADKNKPREKIRQARTAQKAERDDLVDERPDESKHDQKATLGKFDAEQSTHRGAEAGGIFFA